MKDYLIFLLRYKHLWRFQVISMLNYIDSIPAEFGTGVPRNWSPRCAVETEMINNQYVRSVSACILYVKIHADASI